MLQLAFSQLDFQLLQVLATCDDDDANDDAHDESSRLRPNHGPHLLICDDHDESVCV